MNLSKRSRWKCFVPVEFKIIFRVCFGDLQSGISLFNEELYRKTIQMNVSLKVSLILSYTQITASSVQEKKLSHPPEFQAMSIRTSWASRVVGSGSPRRSCGTLAQPTVPINCRSTKCCPKCPWITSGDEFFLYPTVPTSYKICMAYFV